MFRSVGHKPKSENRKPNSQHSRNPSTNDAPSYSYSYRSQRNGVKIYGQKCNMSTGGGAVRPPSETVKTSYFKTNATKVNKNWTVLDFAHAKGHRRWVVFPLVWPRAWVWAWDWDWEWWWGGGGVSSKLTSVHDFGGVQKSSCVGNTSPRVSSLESFTLPQFDSHGGPLGNFNWIARNRRPRPRVLPIPITIPSPCQHPEPLAAINPLQLQIYEPGVN